MDERYRFLRERARRWAVQVQRVIDTPVPTALEGEKQSLLNFARQIKSTLEQVFGAVDEFAPLRSELGSSIPLMVGGSILLAAGAAITKWTFDYKRFMEKAAKVRSLMADGMPQKDAVNMANIAYSKKPIISRWVKSLSPAFIIGGGLLYLAYRRR